ncbi:hypothetical protein [Kitasatospora sp. NPDC051914]|uniref:hypothetical protein n=1 Tax=Kitasatospora sp. NPDC051914 TaxID=3154945 RepID=UPI00341DD386
MSGTPCVTLRTVVDGPVRRLAAALLVPVLAGCGGGGDSGSGSGAAASAAQSTADLYATPPAEGSGQQPQEQRVEGGGNQGGFKTAGQVSANASGQWPYAQISLSSSTGESFTATISNVRDCATGKFTSPETEEIEVVDGSSPLTADFKLSGNPPPNSNPALCISVTIDGETRSVTARSQIDVPSETPGGGDPDDPNENPGGEDPDDPGGETPDNPDPGGEDPGNEDPGVQSSVQPEPAPEPASPR